MASRTELAPLTATPTQHQPRRKVYSYTCHPIAPSLVDAPALGRRAALPGVASFTCSVPATNTDAQKHHPSYRVSRAIRAIITSPWKLHCRADAFCKSTGNAMQGSARAPRQPLSPHIALSVATTPAAEHSVTIASTFTLMKHATHVSSPTCRSP